MKLQTNTCRKVHLVLLLAALVHGGFSQPVHRIKQFTHQDGFHDRIVMSIVQDGLGFLWTSGDGYISKFDGYRVTTYLPSESDSLLQLGFAENTLMIDNTGNVWINNAGEGNPSKSLLQYDRKLDGFKKYKLPIQSYLRGLFPEENSSIIWLGTKPVARYTPTKAPADKTGLYSFDTATGEIIHYLNTTNPDELGRNNNILSITNRGSMLLLGTVNGIWVFDKSSKIFSRPQVNDERLLNGGINIDKHGYPIHWASRTLLIVDSALKVTKEIEVPGGLGESYELSSDHTFFIVKGTNTITKWSPLTKETEVVYHNDEGWLPILIDKDQNLWFGGSSGLKRTQAVPVPLKAISRKPGLHFDTHIIHGEEKDLLVSVGLGNDISTMVLDEPLSELMLFEFSERNSKPGVFLELCEGREFLWVATWNRGIFGIPIDREKPALKAEGIRHFTHAPDNPYTISEDHIRSLYEDENGFLWVGASGDDLCRINLNIAYGAEGSVERFMPNPSDPYAIRSKGVWSIIPGNEEGSIWLCGDYVEYFHNGRFSEKLKAGSAFSGLIQSQNKDIYAVSIHDLYVSKHAEDYKGFEKVLQTTSSWAPPIEDRLGNIWLAERRGLRMFNPETAQDILLFDDLGIQTPSLSVTREGQISYGLNNSILFIDPVNVKIDSGKVQPLITRLEVNYKVPPITGRVSGDVPFSIPADIAVLDFLTLDYQNNHFMLEFAAMELTDPEKNLYRHKLEGYDRDWVETDAKNRTATYTNLPAGTYTFRVKASNHHGVWSENERTLKVIILPPPWRTWWAYTGYSLLAAGLLLWARRNIVRQERLQANLKLEHLELEKAKEVDKVKTSFFTNISHEFRTPLTLIKGPVNDMLEQFKDDPKVQQRLKLVQKNSDLLLRLINQLLDLAKLESGSLTVDKTAGEVHGFIRAIASGFESHARQKGVTLKVEVPQEPAPAMFDKDKVETILINLVNNAIKFTPANGSVTVSANIVANDQHPDFAETATSGKPAPSAQRLSILVADTGIGIPADQRDKIFERFHQVSEAHKEVGTGIGLSLVKELVTLMGGAITVESEMGNGSKFTVTFPVDPATQVETEQQTTGTERTTVNRSPFTAYPSDGISNNEHRITNDEVDSSRPQILVVEDNPDVRAFIIDSLGGEYGYLEAENGKRGLEKATSEIPDLIISDVMMPEMDGIEMTAQIKLDRNTSHIPLILLTAKSTEESKLSGLSSGADDYLTKPFNKQELLLKVRNSINRQSKLKEKLRNELLTETPKEKVLSQDEQFLQKVKETIVARMSDEQLSVESLADDLGMSRVQLYRKVSALTGLAANELIRKLRMHRAAQLLGQNWGPVSQVAYEVGISNLSYFSKVFKEEFGTLPSEYVEGN